jgi:predicted ATPase
MRVLRFCVEGFRSLKDISWEPDNLNVLIGPNATGKSNLLRMLELVSVCAGGGLGKYVQKWGGMGPLVWDGRADRITYTVKTSPVDQWRDVDKDSLTYEFTMERLGQGSSFRIGRELLGNFNPVERGERKEPFKFLERHGAHGVVFDEEEKTLAKSETMLEDESLLSLSGGPLASNHYVARFGSDLAGWSVYHDFHVNADAPIRQSVITRHEKRVEPDGQNLVSVLHTLYTGNRDFKRLVDEAMTAAFGEDYEGLTFPPAAEQRIQLGVHWKSLSRVQSASDLSDGTLRYLFLLAVLASPEPAPLIAIDEPETGLHPSMLPILAEYAVDASRRTQVVLTTHSPQLLDAFGSEKPVTTITKWLGGQTVLEKIAGEELAYWLREYSLGGLFTSGELEDMG